MMKIEIELMKIKFGKKEVSLTIDQAKELYNQLNALFGPKEIIKYWPTTTPWYPLITYSSGVTTSGSISVNTSDNVITGTTNYANVPSSAT